MQVDRLQRQIPWQNTRLTLAKCLTYHNTVWRTHITCNSILRNTLPCWSCSTRCVTIPQHESCRDEKAGGVLTRSSLGSTCSLQTFAWRCPSYIKHLLEAMHTHLLSVVKVVFETVQADIKHTSIKAAQSADNKVLACQLQLRFSYSLLGHSHPGDKLSGKGKRGQPSR